MPQPTPLLIGVILSNVPEWILKPARLQEQAAQQRQIEESLAGQEQFPFAGATEFPESFEISTHTPDIPPHRETPA